MGKSLTLNISKSMADKIPYKCCYEELDIIEIERNVFTRAYEIRKSEEQIQTLETSRANHQLSWW